MTAEFPTISVAIKTQGGTGGRYRRIIGSVIVRSALLHTEIQDEMVQDVVHHFVHEMVKIEIHHVSDPTAFRAVKEARNGGLVRRTNKVSEYVFEGDVGDERRLYLEDWWFHAKFGRGEEARTPNPDDVFVFAYIKSFYDEYGDKWEMSRRYIAKGLNILRDKVCKAVDFFKEAGVLFTEKGTEHKSRTKFKISNKALQKAKEATVKRAKTPSAAVREADEKAAIDRSYARKRAFAEWKAKEKQDQANADETYRAVEAEIKRLDMEAGKAAANVVLAEENGNAEQYKTATELLNELTERKRAAQQLRRESLERLGITEESLTAQYSCKKCSDTGHLPDGRVCECYPRGRP